MINSLFFGQDLNFIHYSVNDGLLSSQVHDITQDKYGRLWFSTDQGLSSYDGYGFKNFTTRDGLTDNTVFKFYPQANGDIWCTSFNKSVFSISGNDPVFKPYPYNDLLLALPDAYVTNSLFVSMDNLLFMAMANCSGFICINQEGKMIHNSLGSFSKTDNGILLNEKQGGQFFFVSKEVKDLEIPGNWHVL
jgi:ligand-binding sensor domain-containing protein